VNVLPRWGGRRAASITIGREEAEARLTSGAPAPERPPVGLGAPCVAGLCGDSLGSLVCSRPT
jgi:hypothetical protein